MRLNTWFSIACILTSAATVADASSPDCLRAAPARQVIETSDCSEDPAQIANNPQIQAALSLVGVKGDQVSFRGCQNGEFATRPSRSRVGRSGYQITYPTPSVSDRQALLGPLVHEIGHILQLEQVGSIPALRSKLHGSSALIELGADFLAGVLLQRAMPNVDRGTFERSLYLIGDYDEASDDWHARPEDRTVAFRLGFYQKDDSSPLPVLEDEFQQNDVNRFKLAVPSESN